MSIWCDKCNEISLCMDTHKCPPKWLVWCVDWDEDQPDAIEVYAHSASQAAEKWAEHTDSDSEYEIVGGCAVEVIAKCGLQLFRLRVCGELVPTYSAAKVEG